MRLSPAATTANFFAGLVFVAVVAGMAPSCSAGAAAPPSDGQLNLKTTCGASGDGVTDDSLALKKCLQLFQASLDLHHPTVLRIPAGIYRITGEHGTMPAIQRHGGVIMGDGPHASYISLTPSYKGDVLAWSEAWTAGNTGRTGFHPQQDDSGPTIQGIHISGTNTPINIQNAIKFYDRNDNVLIRDVEVDNLYGSCFSVGSTSMVPQAYIRESAVYNLKCWYTGTPTSPAVDLSSFTTKDSDATNEIDVYKLAIFSSAGTGLSIRNPNPFGATRRIRLFGLRIEASSGEGLTIGDKLDRGTVANIDIFDLTIINSKKLALGIGEGVYQISPYQINVYGGSIGPGNQSGISVERGNIINLQLSFIDGHVEIDRTATSKVSIGNSQSAVVSLQR